MGALNTSEGWWEHGLWGLPSKVLLTHPGLQMTQAKMMLKGLYKLPLAVKGHWHLKAGLAAGPFLDFDAAP